MTAPGTAPTTMKIRSSGRRPGAGTYGPTAGVRWPIRAANRSPTNRTPASASVSILTDALSPSRRTGSNSNVMTAGFTGRECRGRLQLGHQLPHRVGRVVERRLLVGAELNRDDPLHAARTQDHRHADEEPVDAVLALQEGRARQDALPVAEDRLDHLERRGRRGIERGARLQQPDDLGPAVRGSVDEGLDALGAHELCDRD